jgi:hypothetical protein
MVQMTVSAEKIFLLYLMVLNLIAILLDLTRLTLKIRRKFLEVVKALKGDPVKIYTVIGYVIQVY